jgi:hypothetical protein
MVVFVAEIQSPQQRAAQQQQQSCHGGAADQQRDRNVTSPRACTSGTHHWALDGVVRSNGK